MIGVLIQSRVQTRMVRDDGIVLRMTRYLHLVYDPAEPYAVKLHDSCSSGDLVFGRELLAQALRNGAAGDGAIRLYLTYQGCQLLVVQRIDAAPFALKPDSAAAFLARTYDVVPAGQEGDHVDLDQVIGALLKDAA